MGKPEEALEKVSEIRKQISHSTGSTQHETVLADLTRKCNAALILRASDSLHGSCLDTDSIVSSILASGSTVKPKTAKLLARLNLRRLREKESCEHAWRGWEPPALASASDDDSHVGEKEREGDGGGGNREKGPVADSQGIESIFESLKLDDDDSNNSVEKMCEEVSHSITHSKASAKSSKQQLLVAKEQQKQTDKANAKSKKDAFMRLMKSL